MNNDLIYLFSGVLAAIAITTFLDTRHWMRRALKAEAATASVEYHWCNTDGNLTDDQASVLIELAKTKPITIAPSEELRIIKKHVDELKAKLAERAGGAS